jgi:hypothetical protein
MSIIFVHQKARVFAKHSFLIKNYELEGFMYPELME